MNRERTVSCDAALRSPTDECRYVLQRESYGDSVTVRAVCCTHEGEVVIGLQISGESFMERIRARAVRP